MVKTPRASVRARRVRLEPVAVTSAPATGWFAAVTVPESTVVPVWASAPGALARTRTEMRASARSGPPGR